ncbi:fatty acid desaturase [Alphaproteobacteria bacterium]|nr:fatty acid desaturase [Alphaproteobacteria bacterium]MDB2641825.1 fatty acid desaturase [Alphaproteobacteria bacterium]
MNSQTVKSERDDNLKQFQLLMERPKVAWPTIFLFMSAWVLFGASCYGYVSGRLPLWSAILLNTVAAYFAFTVAHDATHSSVSTNRKLNDWLGRISTMLLEPAPAFGVFRFVHMQHHKFTNDPERDPDSYAGRGPALLLPLKWATVDAAYFRFYLSPSVFNRRPKKERMELYIGGLVGLTIIGAAIYGGWLTYYLLLHFVPTRIVKVFLTLSFDFLPHYPHQTKAQEDPFQSTSNRVGFEWLMTPLFLYQNYHLVHHLYPTAPFYRNLKLWQSKRQFHESKNPALVGAFSLKPKPHEGS